MEEKERHKEDQLNLWPSKYISKANVMKMRIERCVYCDKPRWDITEKEEKCKCSK